MHNLWVPCRVSRQITTITIRSFNWHLSLLSKELDILVSVYIPVQHTVIYSINTLLKHLQGGGAVSQSSGCIVHA